LIRFSYAEIITVTQNFSKGKFFSVKAQFSDLLNLFIYIFIYNLGDKNIHLIVTFLMLLYFCCLGRVLGRGALSYVFRGKVGLLRTAVPIKQLDKEDKEASKAFCRELMIASFLHKPFIVPLVSFCMDAEEGLFLVYKYVSGGSLERHLYGMISYFIYVKSCIVIM